MRVNKRCSAASRTQRDERGEVERERERERGGTTRVNGAHWTPVIGHASHGRVVNRTLSPGVSPVCASDLTVVSGAVITRSRHFQVTRAE